MSFQTFGWVSFASRSTTTECVELSVSPSEYGSVTTLVSTLPVDGTKTSTS
ncbi:hypothetical protein D3C74_299810 [compost metagenome]